MNSFRNCEINVNREERKENTNNFHILLALNIIILSCNIIFLILRRADISIKVLYFSIHKYKYIFKNFFSLLLKKN